MSNKKYDREKFQSELRIATELIRNGTSRDLAKFAGGNNQQRAREAAKRLRKK